MSEGDIVAIHHGHAKYSMPYFLGVVRETPAGSEPEERLRIAWLEAPTQTRAGYTYTLDSWVDEYALTQQPVPRAGAGWVLRVFSC